MLQIYVILAGLWMSSRGRLRQRREDSRADTGAISLETVIISLGLFLLAAALVGGLTAAFYKRLNQLG